MHTTLSFTASAAPSLSQFVAGGSYALPNPAAATSATALLLSAPAGGPVLWIFSATGSQAPAWGGPAGDGHLNAGGSVILTDTRALTSPYIVVSGVLSAAPGNISTAALLNS